LSEAQQIVVDLFREASTLQRVWLTAEINTANDGKRKNDYVNYARKKTRGVCNNSVHKVQRLIKIAPKIEPELQTLSDLFVNGEPSKELVQAIQLSLSSILGKLNE
jgi:hypothetical protein